MKRSRAFTLVELLVVVGIIAILVTLLIPSLKKARLQAIRVNCASNMRQSMMAMLTYAGRYGEFPVNIHPTTGSLFYNGAEGIGLSAPAWNGAEGAVSYWRAYLLQEKLADANVLGCAARLDDSYWWRGAQDNGFETVQQMRKAPPWYYFGPGVDLVRFASYYGGFNTFVRPGRSYKGKGRAPIFMDPFYEYQGYMGPGDFQYGSTIVSHTSEFTNPRNGEPTWYPSSSSPTPRIYDHHFGWTDGSVTFIRKRIFAAGFPTIIPLNEYDWRVRQAGFTAK